MCSLLYNWRGVVEIKMHVLVYIPSFELGFNLILTVLRKISYSYPLLINEWFILILNNSYGY